MNDEARREPGPEHRPGWQAGDPAGPAAFGPWAGSPVSVPDPSFSPWTSEPPTQEMEVQPPAPPQWAPMPQAPPVAPPPPVVGPPMPPQVVGPQVVGPPVPHWGPPPQVNMSWAGGDRRVVPPPAPPRRTGLVKGLLIGLVVGLVVAGAGGYLLGSTLGGGGAAAGPGPSAGPSLSAYEASQLALNKPKFDGDLTALAQPWLPFMGACVTNTDIDGPALQSGEAKHVFCRYSGVSVHFAEFKSSADRDLGRTYREQLSLSADGLAPGQASPGHKTGGVSGAPGNYIEYAFKENDGRVLCGIWWDRDGGTAALMLETLCEEGLGGTWDPLRDLWRRHT